MALMYPCSCRAGREPESAGHCQEASMLLGPWEAGPLPSLTPELLGETGVAAAGGRLSFLKFRN